MIGKRLAVLMTCHNRKEKTVACLVSLYGATVTEDVEITVYLVDDGSNDGTTSSVKQKFPLVNIISGNGTLFWNGGMRVAWSEAMKRDFDYYLWLNDDTELYSETIAKLFATCQRFSEKERSDVIVVGTTVDPQSGVPTYGGQQRNRRWRALDLLLVEPKNEPVPCDTLNGNCVLVPRKVAVDVGNLDPVFIHAMGDIDYGLRARAAGYGLWVMPGYAGTCTGNPATGTYKDTTLPLSKRWEKMRSPKGLPLAQWKLMMQRHGGTFWILYWLMPYARMFLSPRLKK